MVAVLITIVMASIKLWPMMAEARSTRATAQGVQLQTLGNSVSTYSTQFYGPLVNGTAISGVVNPYAPTVAELQSLGLLNTSFSTTNQYNGGYGVRISKVPASCVAPSCDIENLVYLTNPITNPANGRLDGAALGQAAQVMQADGGFSDSSTPGNITGPSGAWSVTNPVTLSGIPVAGILAMRSGYNSSTMAQFMRRDGQLPATGTQDFGGQTVNNVGFLNTRAMRATSSVSILGDTYIFGNTNTNGISNTGNLTTSAANVTGALTTGSLTAGTATVNGSLTAGNTTINGTTTHNGATTVNGTLGVSGAATLASTLTVSGATTTAGITNNGQLTNSGDVKAPRVYLTTMVNAGSACPGYSGYQATTTTGQIASCVNGVWAAYTPAPPPSPCNATSVSWQGCSGSLPYTQSGNTANATVSSGTGYATYSCQNGSWAFQSGSCTPPAAGCSGQYVYWNGSASCMAYVGTTSSGTGQWVNSTSNSGSAYVTCSNGNYSVSSASCSAATATFYNPTATNGAYLASNSTARTTYCQAMGYSNAYGAGSQQDAGGTNTPVCWSIDGNLNCTGGGNCSSMPAVNPGCWVQTAVTCQ